MTNIAMTAAPATPAAQAAPSATATPGQPVAQPTTVHVTPGTGSGISPRQVPAGQDNNGATPIQGQTIGGQLLTGQAESVPAGQEWWNAITNETTRGYAQLKGWQNMDAVVESYQNLEKLNGRDKVALPKDINDNEARDIIYDKLGRPKTADEYKLTVPQGASDNYLKAMTPLFHKAGLNQQQAEILTNGSNEFAAAVRKSQEEGFLRQADADLRTHTASWGKDADKHFAAGQKAGAAFGLQEMKAADGKTPMMKAMERAMGTSNFLDFMASVGHAIGEDSYTGGDENRAFTSPEAARAQKSALQADKAWVDRYLAGGTKEVAEMRKLNEYLAGQS